MNIAIKDRVEKIDQGIVPEGYKKTKVGIIPGDWEVKKLGELGEFFRGKGIPKSKIDESGIDCIIYGQIYTIYDYFTKELYSKVNNEVANNSIEIEYGDFLFTSSGETSEDIGKCVMYLGNKRAVAGGDIVIMRPKAEIKHKIYSYLLNSESINKQKYKFGQGHSVVHLYSSNLKDIKIPLVPLQEQEKIADILSTWDKAIENIEKLIKEKEMQKKGLMQELLTGETRLPGFNREWKEVKLGEIGKFLNGKGLAKKDIMTDGKYKCLLYGELFTTYSEVIEKIESKTNKLEKNCVLGKYNDVLFPTSTTVDALSLIKPSVLKVDDVILGGDIMIYRGNNRRINGDFLSYYFNGPGEKELAKFAEGITIIHIYSSEVKDFKLNLPPLPEQKAIAEILSTADKEIELLKKLLINKKEEKKGLMQLLLTGIVRVQEA